MAFLKVEKVISKVEKVVNESVYKGVVEIMLLQPYNKLLFIGDSITDCGRNPLGEGLSEALGRGYVAQIEALLHTVYPELFIRVVNKGTGGNTIRDLKARWQTDVLDMQSDWLSIMIGINDVWRQFDTPLIKEGHVYIEEYEDTLRELVERTLPQLKGLVLMTPYYLEPNRNDAMRARMDAYGQVVKKLANDNKTLFVDTQAAFDTLLEHVYPATFAWDRIHPSQVGHMVITRAFLNALGFTWTPTRA